MTGLWLAAILAVTLGGTCLLRAYARGRAALRRLRAMPPAAGDGPPTVAARADTAPGALPYARAPQPGKPGQAGRPTRLPAPGHDCGPVALGIVLYRGGCAWAWNHAAGRWNYAARCTDPELSMEEFERQFEQ